MMNTKESKLSDIFNLTSHEARLYLAALNFDHATLSDLAKKAEIARTAAYPPIQSLIRKGLLAIIKIKKRTHYQAVGPEHLKYILERKQVDLEDIIKSLTKNIIAGGGKLEINYYAGLEGAALASDIFLDNSPKNSTWKTFETPEFNLAEFGEAQFEDYIKRRVAKNIYGKIIIPADLMSPWIKKHLADDKKELRQTILVSPEIYPLDISIAVGGDMVQFIGARDNLFSILIKSAEVARTVSSIHDMVWDRFKPE